MRVIRSIFEIPAEVDIRRFHFARILHGDSRAKSLARHEHYIAAALGLKPGMRVLELGCGTGSTALELANFENITVLGVDEDPDKVRTAIASAREAQMSQRVSFIRADLSRLSDTCPVEQFDCLYSIEALKVHSSFEKSFHAIRQLLKPTGKFAIFEWCWTYTFDTHNPDHCRLAELVELTTRIGHRAPHERTIHAALIAFQHSGLQLLHHEDLAAREDKIPWYSPLEAAMSGPSIVWQPDTNAFGGLSKPAANALIEAGRNKFFTPMALFVGRKPPPDVPDYDQVQL